MTCHLISVGTSLRNHGDLSMEQLLGLNGDECVRRRSQKADPLSQELSYLHLHYQQRGQAPDPGDRVYLLASDTDLGKACANLTRDYVLQANFSGGPLSHCKVVVLKGLDPTNDKLGEEALDCLARRVAKVVKKFGFSHEIVLNISGGFKGMIPYATFLAAIYPQLQLRYLYQTASTPVSIPTLPVSFDAAAWRDWRSLIKSVEEMSPGEARRSLVKALPTSLRPLFTEEGDLGFLGRALSQRFKNERTSQLNLHGQGDQLLVLLQQPYRQRVEAQLPNWRHSTVGDKVPEMVDHGRGHLQRVQELLAQILIPLHHSDPNFFNQEEYLALIGALWLHDSGHSAESLDLPLPAPFDNLCHPPQLHLPTAGLPSLSRDLHQLLIGSLLLNPETRPAFLPDDDFWNPQRLAAMLWVCLYHRRKMPLVEGTFAFGPNSAPLIRVTQACPEVCMVGETPVRVRLLAALYSLCDGCDIQSERAASDDELFARRHLLRRNVSALLQLARQAVECQSGGPDARTTLASFLALRQEILDFCLTGRGPVEVQLKALEEQATSALHAFLARTYFANQPPQLEELTVMSILDRLQFLSRQSGFYTHHRGVEAVYITYLGNRQFRVCASGEPGVLREIVLGASQDKKGGFAGELERSGPVLRAHGLDILVDEESLRP